MSGLNDLLDLYAPPPVPEGLATRAIAAAVAQPQHGRRIFARWRRAGGRGGWKRGTLIGSAALGLAFTSAVAAEVVSGGQIEIPVVHQVVEAFPSLRAAPLPTVPKRHLAKHETKRASATSAATAEQPPAPVAGPAPPSRERFVQRFQQVKQRVAERRAAGLPTPYADRLESQAKRIVQRRAAAGRPVPSLDQVEMRLAMRQARQRRLLRQMARDPAAITDTQIQQLAQRLPPEKRERFLALSPEMQRQLIQRRLQRMQQRRRSMQEGTEPQPPASGPEPQPQPASEGFSQPPR
jgi:hypothetical protein